LESYATAIDNIKFIGTYQPKGVLFNSLRFPFVLWQLIFSLSTDKQIKIVHVHTASRGSFVRKSFVVLIGKLFSKKVVLHVHGGEFHIFYKKWWFIRWAILAIARKCDLIICVSPKLRDLFASFQPKARVAILNNPVTGNRFQSGSSKRDDVVQFLFLGKVCESKGVFILLDAVNMLPSVIRNQMRLTIGGIGDISALKNKVSDLKLEKWVTYAGWINGDDKYRALAVSDILVLPSYNEGLPISILEGMAAGLPIVATNVGGIPQVVTSGHNGVLVEAGDPDGLRDAMQKLIECKTLRIKMGNQSTMDVKPFIVDHVIEQLGSMYDNLR
jgi:glycosyltransferase involved in cell wall biosynthesis